MELFDVMRTTFAAREFTDELLPDATLFNILDRARFAPSGGNRQGWRGIVVRERATRRALAALTAPAAKRYAAPVAAGDSPWNTNDPPSVDAATIQQNPAPRPPTEAVLHAVRRRGRPAGLWAGRSRPAAARGAGRWASSRPAGAGAAPRCGLADAEPALGACRLGLQVDGSKHPIVACDPASQGEERERPEPASADADR